MWCQSLNNPARNFFLFYTRRTSTQITLSSFKASKRPPPCRSKFVSSSAPSQPPRTPPSYPRPSARKRDCDDECAGRRGREGRRQKRCGRFCLKGVDVNYCQGGRYRDCALLGCTKGEPGRHEDPHPRRGRRGQGQVRRVDAVPCCTPLWIAAGCRGHLEVTGADVDKEAARDGLWNTPLFQAAAKNNLQTICKSCNF